MGVTTLAFIAGTALSGSVTTETPTNEPLTFNLTTTDRFNCSMDPANPDNFSISSSEWNRAPPGGLFCALHCNGGRLGQMCAGKASNFSISGVINFEPALNSTECERLYHGGGRMTSPCEEVCRESQLPIECRLNQDPYGLECTRNGTPVGMRHRQTQMEGCYYERKFEDSHRESEYFYFHHGQTVVFKKTFNKYTFYQTITKVQSRCFNGELRELAILSREKLPERPKMGLKSEKGIYHPSVVGLARPVKVFTPRCK